MRKCVWKRFFPNSHKNHYTFTEYKINLIAIVSQKNLRFIHVAIEVNISFACQRYEISNRQGQQMVGFFFVLCRAINLQKRWFNIKMMRCFDFMACRRSVRKYAYINSQGAAVIYIWFWNVFQELLMCDHV